MGLHKPFDRSLYSIAGAVKLTGGSITLAKGQLALIDEDKTTQEGAKVLGSLAGVPKNHGFLALRMGIDERSATDRSYSNKPSTTMNFSLDQVVDLKVTIPQRTEQSLDEVILGYNGIDPNSAFVLEPNDVAKRITLEIYGDAYAFLGGGMDKEVMSWDFEVPRCPVFNDCIDCDSCVSIDCKEWTANAIEVMKRHQLVGGTLLGDMVDITPVLDCDNADSHVLTPYDFYCLEICDTGDATALANVQAQYELTVTRTERVGAISKYQVLLPQADGVPTAFVAEGGAYIKGCADCVAPAVLVAGGIVYSVLIEDNGVDAVPALPGQLSYLRADASGFGVGVYTVVVDDALTDVEIAAFVVVEPTATIELLGEATDMCEFPDAAAIIWVECGTCNVSEECYLIDLPDTECGTDRLAELQGVYPDLDVELEGTTGGCQTRYKATVVSNLVCEECDDIFLEAFITKAPEEYDTVVWTADPANDALDANTNCKCGIKVKSKPFLLKTGEALRDSVNFREDSLRIRISGGYATEIREGIGTTAKNPMTVTQISRFEPRTHLGGNLQDLEEYDRFYFRGEQQGDYLQRLLRGMESSIQDQCMQYADFALTIKHSSHSQGFAQTHGEPITYHFFVELGKHYNVEGLLNSIASAAGVGTVQATA